MDRWVPLSNTHAASIFGVIAEQLPQGLRDRLSVELVTDSYHVACSASFVTRAGDRFMTRLEPMGDGQCARVPEAFVAHLCLVVR